jgi:3-hydroxyacyl-CoA dehydrogenase
MNKVARTAPEAISAVGIVGTGAVGASWAALFMAHGMRVFACDPAADGESKARALIAQAWPALMQLLGTPAKPVPDTFSFLPTIAQVAAQAQVLQENGPERPDLKAQILAEIDAHADAEKIILSSTGGIPPSSLQKVCKHPERFVVAHPFNPAHLIPLVEIVGGKLTGPDATSWAMAFMRRVGKHPIALLREADGHMTNRLQFALLREAVHCLAEGIATPTDIDDAVRYGLGPRWALMGGLLTMHLAGGAGGMKGILEHAGLAIEGWWKALGEPQLDAATRQKLLTAADEVAHGHSIQQWEQWRDRNLARMVTLIQQDPAPARAAAQHHSLKVGNS